MFFVILIVSVECKNDLFLCTLLAFVHVYIFTAMEWIGMIFHMASPNTETMQYKVLFSHRTVQHPSVALSQKHELAVCKPPPDFCIIVHVTGREIQKVKFYLFRDSSVKKSIKLSHRAYQYI